MVHAVLRSYALRRLGLSVLVLVASSIVVFVALRIIPGDPTQIRAARPGVTEAQLEELRHQLGLDSSLPEQYLKWVGGLIHGDFGASYFSDFSTTELIRAAVGPTFELALVAAVLGLVMAVPAAILSVLRPGSIVDRVLSVATAGGLAIPPFLFGIAFIALFSVKLGWLPARGYVSFFDDPGGHVRFIALPAVTMGIAVAAPILRMLRGALMEELGSDYVVTARSKGLTQRAVVIHHALRNAFIPTLSLVGLTIGYMLGGVVVVEHVFSWPGLGGLAVQSVLNRDYAVLQGVVLLAAVGFVLTSLAADVVAHYLDPRVRQVSR